MFENYEIFDPGVDKPLSEVTRAEAEQHFQLHLASLKERLDELKKLVEASRIQLDYSDASLDRLDEWFPSVVEEFGIEESWPTPETFSLCNDLAVYLGEHLRRHGRNLEWRMQTGNKRDMAYQRPVIGGFSQTKDSFYCVDFDDMLCRYAVRLAEGGGREEGYIPKITIYPVRFV